MKVDQLGPYRIVKQIGKGGMGAVYEAICEDDGPQAAGTRVAIKALSPQLAIAEGFRERFEAEIESLKKLKHVGIVRLYGYGEQDGLLFYSMELVEGPSLEEELRSGRKFNWQETLQIGIQICRALKHAHDHGVVHRDIKPANLMLTADNEIKIADFGIARLFGGTQLTVVGGVLGTADYMSPEQADGQPVTEKCDQYSLGGVMYALLAGRPPFRAKTLPEMLQLQRFAEPEPVRRYAPDTPDQLERLITQLLAKESAQRFPNVLVLSRHMEAMEKALSRSIQPVDQDEVSTAKFPQSSTPGTPTIAEQAVDTLDTFAVLPQETSAGTHSEDLYDAQTLDQPFDSEGMSPNSASSAAEQEPTLTDTAVAKTATHFTTVDEDARRQRELSQGSRLSMVAQLGGLVAALGVLIWGGWQLMQPPTADELYAEITQVTAEGQPEISREALKGVLKDVESFLGRFPDDPRCRELKPLQEQLEFRSYEYQAHNRSRFSGASGRKPIEQLYFSALKIAEDNPSRAIEQLQALIVLYDPAAQLVDYEVARAATGRFEEFGDPRLLVVARQRIDQFKKQLAQQSAAQLPALQERFERAQASSPDQARRMYQAIVSLYDGKTWAQVVVDQAKAELANPME